MKTLCYVMELWVNEIINMHNKKQISRGKVQPRFTRSSVCKFLSRRFAKVVVAAGTQAWL